MISNSFSGVISPGIVWPVVPGVRVNPGAMALIVSPCSLSSVASDRVNPMTPPLLAHAAGQGFGHQEHGIEIDRHDPAPVFEGDVIEGLHRIDAGIVDQDVATTAVLLDLLF